MAIVNNKFEFVFLCEPHTGSRAVRDALLTIPGSVETNGKHHLDLQGCIRDGFLSGREACEAQVYATIRNPHDWLVTKWFVLTRAATFEEFVRRVAVEFQQHNTLFWMTRDDVDLYIRYEALEVGLNMVLADRGYTAGVELDKVGATIGKPHWTDLWWPELAQFAEENYGDIRQYQYRTHFDGLTAIGSEPTTYITIEL